MAQALAPAPARTATPVSVGRWAWPALALTVALVLIVLVVWPLVRLLAESLSATGASRGGAMADLATQTAIVSLVSTVITVTLALLLAFAITRMDVPGARVVSALVLLPIVAPPFLVGLGIAGLAGRDGLLPRLLDVDASIEGVPGIVASQVMSFLPHAYLVLAGTLSRIDPALEEAAESLGAGAGSTLRRITFALARPDIVSALLIVLLLCLTDFANPMVVGGGFRTLTTEIYARAVVTGERDAAVRPGLVLLVPCLVILLVVWLVGRPPVASVTLARPSFARPMPRPLGGALAAIAAVTATLVAVVHAVVLAGSVAERDRAEGGVSLHHYARAFVGDGARAIESSVELAVIVAVIGTALAFACASVVERPVGSIPMGLTRLVSAMAVLPVALPGIVLGLAYRRAFVQPSAGPRAFCLLAAAVIVVALPGAVRRARSAFRDIAPDLPEAAWSLGAGAPRTVRRVVLPLLMGPAVSVFVYFFVSGMLAVSAIVVLIVPDFALAPVTILAHLESGRVQDACVVIVLVQAVVLASLGLLRACGGEGRVIATMRKGVGA